MADNVTANTTDSGGPTFATDDDGTAHWPYVKVAFGANNTQTIVSTTNPLPVDIRGENASVTVDNAGTFAVQATQSGTWTVDLGATDNAVLDAIQTAVETIDNAISGTEMQVDVVAPLPAGTNAIGKLAANSGVDIGDVDVTSQPARAVGTDSIGAYPQTDAIYNGATALTPKFAVIDDATSGDNTIVAAVSGKKIRVLSYVLVSAGTATVRFESGATGTALTGQMSLVANTGVSSGFNPFGHFETAADTLLNLEISGAISIDGHLTYVEV